MRVGERVNGGYTRKVFGIGSREVDHTRKEWGIGFREVGHTRKG